MEDKTPPRDIEHVPFRRQDRRILNSRKKRVMDRKLIRCIVLTGLLMLAAGAGLIAVWWMYEEGGQNFTLILRHLNIYKPNVGECRVRN